MSEAPSTKPFTPTEPSETLGAPPTTPGKPVQPPTTPATSTDKPAEVVSAPSVVPSAPVPAAPSTATVTQPAPAPGTAPAAQPAPVQPAPVAPPPAAVTQTAPAVTEAAPPKPASVTEPREAHVLVVEDNVPNFVLIARMLAFMGVQRCEWKTSGWQVVQFADTLPRVDLILMDIRLPYEDGYQALQKLRANARLKDTIVCAVTAEASEDQMRRARKAGFNGFLGKPLDPDKFPSQIRRLLAGEEVWEWK